MCAHIPESPASSASRQPGGCAVYDYDYDDGDWRRYRGQPYAYEVPRYRVYDDGWRSERRYYDALLRPTLLPGAALMATATTGASNIATRSATTNRARPIAASGIRATGRRGGQPQWRGHSPQRWQQHGGQDRPCTGPAGRAPRWRN